MRIGQLTNQADLYRHSKANLETMQKDLNFQAIRNKGPKRLGHTILYDRLVNEVARHDICMIYHADMYLCPGALDSIEEHLNRTTITSTRT